MKKTFIFFLSISFSTWLMANDKDSTVHYNLPDSVKAVQFMTDVTINSYNPKKWFSLHLKTAGPSIQMRPGKKSGSFIFYPGANLGNIQRGLNTSFSLKDFGISFMYEWRTNETYKLLISQASDSAQGITIYSGYVFLPREGKWKFLGSGKIETWRPSLVKPILVFHQGNKQLVNFTIGPTWVQRSNGSWKNLRDEILPNPVINLFGHLDSAKQRSVDAEKIEASLEGKGYQYKDGIGYIIMKMGNGRQVEATDTVSVLYQVNILNESLIIDEAKNTPARFPLNRLIRGWSIGVPLIKVGGKIRLVIPSDLAYSIRTRSPKIPPNSILVFDIEVVEAKPPN